MPEQTHAESLRARLLGEQVARQLADFPAEVRAMAPAGPVEDRLAWIERARPLADAVTRTARANDRRHVFTSPADVRW